jgi:hypothetical protein
MEAFGFGALEYAAGVTGPAGGFGIAGVRTLATQVELQGAASVDYRPASSLLVEGTGGPPLPGDLLIGDTVHAMADLLVRWLPARTVYLGAGPQLGVRTLQYAPYDVHLGRGSNTSSLAVIARLALEPGVRFGPRDILASGSG